MHIAWISGWGIPKAYVLDLVQNHFPEHEHTVYNPTPGELELLGLSQFDQLVGYSLGALLAEKYFTECKPILLAPFHHFPEHCRSLGRLKKNFAIDPIHALNDFYKLIGIDLKIHTLPYPIEDLAWGLEVLERESIEKSSAIAYIGESDPILKCELVKKYFKNTQVLKDTGHALEEILPHVQISL